jgi:hypothetical protein
MTSHLGPFYNFDALKGMPTQPPVRFKVRAEERRRLRRLEKLPRSISRLRQNRFVQSAIGVLSGFVRQPRAR